MKKLTPEQLAELEELADEFGVPVIWMMHRLLEEGIVNPNGQVDAVVDKYFWELI